MTNTRNKLFLSASWIPPPKKHYLIMGKGLPDNRIVTQYTSPQISPNCKPAELLLGYITVK